MRGAPLAIVMLAGATVGLAADRPISGTKLLVTRSASGAQKLTFVSKDVGFLFPAIGSGDDPTAGGATLTIVSPLEQPVTLTMPAGAGNPGWTSSDRATLDAYRYTNGAAPAGSPVRSLGLREKRSIKLVARRTGVALAGPQGSLGIRLTTGTLRSCARFVGSSVVSDRPGRFVGRGAIATAVADCSDVALGAPPPPPPVCGNGVREGTEQCDGTDGLDQTPPDVRCNAQCQFCGQSTCRYPMAIDIPCCDAAATCVILGANGGSCVVPPTVTTTTSTTTTTTSITDPFVCGNGIVEYPEQCDGPTCSDPLRPHCVQPGESSYLQCTCCNSQQCYDGGADAPVPCCPGLTCAHLPPVAGQGFGLGVCAATCAPYGTECVTDGLPCCGGNCLPINPNFPFLFCQ